MKNPSLPDFFPSPETLGYAVCGVAVVDFGRAIYMDALSMKNQRQEAKQAQMDAAAKELRLEQKRLYEARVVALLKGTNPSHHLFKTD